jgi:hypothetical protein
VSYTSHDVEAGRRLVSEMGRSQWALGDLALRVAPVGSDGVNNGTGEILARFAEEIGADADHLRQWRWVAAAWPPVTRVTGVSYTLHRALANDPLRREVLAQYLASTPKPTSRGLQAFQGKRPTPEFTRSNRRDQVSQALAEMPAEERAEVARDALADPDVADRVFNAPDRRQPGSATATARGNAARAFERSREEDARRSEQRSASDPAGRTMSERSAQQNIAAACDLFAKTVADEMRRAGPLQDGERPWLADAAARSGAAQAAVMQYVDTGRSEIDAALDDLLAS